MVSRVAQPRKVKRCVCCKVRKSESRWLCGRCLGALYAMIEAGKITMEAAVEQKLIAPAGKPGRKPKRRKVAKR